MKKLILLLILLSTNPCWSIDWTRVIYLVQENDSKNEPSSEGSDTTIEPDQKSPVTFKHDSFDVYQDKNGRRQGVIRLGNEGPHGGDHYGAEFTEIGMRVYQEFLLNEEIVEEYSINVPEFLKTIEEVVVYSDGPNQVRINGQEVDAINFPYDNKILVNRKRWREMYLESKLKLVFHEYLGIMNIERDVYSVSVYFNDFLDELAREIKSESLNPIRYFGKCSAPTPLSFYGAPCSTNRIEVREAINCSKEKALDRCRRESLKSCKEASTIREMTTNNGKVPFCEVTSIVKGV